MRSYRCQRVLAGLIVVCGLTVATTSSSWAIGEGSIDHTENADGKLQILYSIPELTEGAEPDLASVEVTVDGKPLRARATSATDTELVKRTTVMAIDISNSMRGDRFVQAKTAAKAFLEAAPADVYIGIVAFAGSVDVIQQPTLNHESAAALVDDLSLSRETRLNDGVIAAARTAGTEGQRSLLVLSDGRDTSQTPLADVIETIFSAGVRVDVVALGKAAQANPPLAAMAEEGGGTVIKAEDPHALTALFSDEAAALARQVLITADIPESAVIAGEGSLAVSLSADGETYSDNAFVSFEEEKPRAPRSSPPEPVSAPSLLASFEALLIGLGALGVGLLVVLVGVLGAIGARDEESLEDKIAVYTKAGSKARRAAAHARHGSPTDPSKGVTGSAVSITEKALAGNSGLEAALASRLEGAALSFRPAEWLLLHAGIAIGAALLGFLVSSGNGLVVVAFFLVGAVFPWLFLSLRKSRRLKAFNAQLAETLQLIAGSLSAGLSLAQSLDTVVREGNDPIASEFKRALIEARLGVAVETSLDSIAKRMESADFEWVVMAIRIQREVGGNLAELLLKVAGTMRERDYLRRQVKTLSAEGRMSAWILGGLPPAMLAYMLLTNPAYLNPLISRPIGWLMLGAMVVLMLIGGFWMSKVVKVDV